MISVKGLNESHRSFYPCYDWKIGDVLKIIEESGISLPRDYLYSKRSISSIHSGRLVTNLEKGSREDFEAIEQWFPLVRASIARDAFQRQRAETKADAAHGTR